MHEKQARENGMMPNVYFEGSLFFKSYLYKCKLANWGECVVFCGVMVCNWWKATKNNIAREIGKQIIIIAGNTCQIMRKNGMLQEKFQTPSQKIKLLQKVLPFHKKKKKPPRWLRSSFTTMSTVSFQKPLIGETIFQSRTE